MSYRRKLQDRDKSRSKVVKRLREGGFKETARYTKISSQCLKKTGYSSLRQAERVINSLDVISRSGKLRVYECPFCGMYHLTKKRIMR